MRTAPDDGLVDRDQGHAAGYALVEAAAAISLVALAIALAVPLTRSPPPSVQVASDAASLAAALRITRASAMATNLEQRLSLSESTRTYTSSAGSRGRLDPRTHLLLHGFPNAGGGQHVVRFAPEGQATSGSIVLRIAGAEAVVVVNGVTGHVAVKR